MLVVGNGESRTNINIDKIDGPKVGCNALWRDYSVDYLICVDKRMVEESIRGNVNINGTLIYTREEWYGRYKGLRIRKVPPLPYNGTERWDEPFQWGSGPYAVLLASILSNKIHMIGFDLYGNKKLVNNIYKDTEHYDASNKNAVDPRYWIHQIGMVFNCFPNTQFKILVKDDWTLPKAWTQPNVKVDNISTLLYNKI